MSAGRLPPQCEGCHHKDRDYYSCARWRLHYAWYSLKKAIWGGLPKMARRFLPAPDFDECSLRLPIFKQPVIVLLAKYGIPLSDESGTAMPLRDILRDLGEAVNADTESLD